MKPSQLNKALKAAGSLAMLLLALLITNPAAAQYKTLTLEEALKLGIENSKVLKLSQSRIDQAVSQYQQAKDRSLPTGKASFGYNRAQIPANKLNFGEETLALPTSANAYLGTLSLNQVIFAGNKLKYARESTNLLSEVARLDAVNDKDQIAYNIIDSYYNLYKVLQSKKVVDQNLATIDAQIKQSQRFFDQGLVTKNDVLRFQLQRSNIELNGIDLENNRRIINYNMNILLGLPETTQLGIVQIIEADRNALPLTSYLDSAMTNRPEFKQLDLRTQVADLNIKSIKANTTPTLSASGSAYYVGVAANPIPKSGNYITPISIGLTVGWDFGSLWTNKNKVNEAKLQREEVMINRGITLDNVKDEVNQSYQNYKAALDKITLLQTSINQANENNRILESKYKSNISSATDRADAQTLLYQAQINLELAKADAGLAYYTLLKSTGKLNK
ncbi:MULTISPECIES: TolC family protein [unclassified Mucilaginibacter]|uniref:TolC family protein n=1 Tax=unclassified Mucilaginibacter TaxID=2617802 RepID=UPI002AC9B8E7|nr:MULTISPECIES: TolC family protein [unclassified Mucilaginibacter]MEB0264068.1 TolC family protein [Mucilaginibacter sp. 10I4]MEB0280224.1 TolC family protein [Mucilaginibacter sp. 10B2]MEB0301153.1 TolC family protein [Mucilaginibacter sp. 5C4]WPX24367.1 TolC family protein [Mucilaginibacter sp. 5C4]